MLVALDDFLPRHLGFAGLAFPHIRQWRGAGLVDHAHGNIFVLGSREHLHGNMDKAEADGPFPDGMHGNPSCGVKTRCTLYGKRRASVRV
ncbi:hypothetical protein D3C76_1112530 [compost metagenome]